MKTTIYDLLGMIKDGKAPKKILFNDEEWEWYKFDYKNKNSWDLFDEYVITDILDNEVIILETTITYNQDNYYQYQPYTGEVEIKCNSAKNLLESDKIKKLDVLSYDKCIHGVTHKEKELALEIWDTQIKINEIIDRINSL